METFGRGCFYIIIGIVILMFMALILRSTINIPFFIAIPLVIFAFWVASKKTKRNRGE